MSHRFYISDHHWGHKNILTFKRHDGTPLREFDSVEAMDEHMVERWNSVVGPNDHVYHLGDVVIKKHDLPVLDRLNGKKVLIMGNHDNHKIKNLIPYFYDIRSYDRKNHEIRIIASHVPLHPNSIGNWGTNIHGHTHYRNLEDPRYFNVSVENLNYTPIEMHAMMSMIKKRNEDWGYEWSGKCWLKDGEYIKRYEL